MLTIETPGDYTPSPGILPPDNHIHSTVDGESTLAADDLDAGNEWILTPVHSDLPAAVTIRETEYLIRFSRQWIWRQNRKWLDDPADPDGLPFYKDGHSIRIPLAAIINRIGDKLTRTRLQELEQIGKPALRAAHKPRDLGKTPTDSK